MSMANSFARLKIVYVLLIISRAPKQKRRKLNNRDEEDNIEEEYERNLEDDQVQLKPLLPIKTKQGVIPQSTRIIQGNYISYLPLIFTHIYLL